MNFRFSYCTIFTFYFILTMSPLFSQSASNSASGKRSAIVEADGYTFLSEDKTIKDLRNEAKAAAKREALEKGQTYIKSTTRVENFQLTYDLIESEAEGYVKILENKDHGITEDNRYHYWIKAEVEYSLKQPGSGAPSDILKNKNAPLSVDVRTERKEYTAGEKIRIFIRGNKDFFARVVYRDVSGNLLQLLPNQHRKYNFFKGGEEFTIPGPGDRFNMEVGPPFGVENIIVYASNSPMGEVEVNKMGDSLYRVQGGLSNFSQKTRSVKIVTKDKLSTSQGAEFYEASCELITKSK